MPSLNGQHRVDSIPVESEDDVMNQSTGSACESVSPTGRVTRSSSRLKEVKTKDVDSSQNVKSSGLGKRKTMQQDPAPSSVEEAEQPQGKKSEIFKTPRRNATLPTKFKGSEEKARNSAASVRTRANPKLPAVNVAPETNEEEEVAGDAIRDFQMEDTVDTTLKSTCEVYHGDANEKSGSLERNETVTNGNLGDPDVLLGTSNLISEDEIAAKEANSFGFVEQTPIGVISTSEGQSDAVDSALVSTLNSQSADAAASVSDAHPIEEVQRAALTLREQAMRSMLIKKQQQQLARESQVPGAGDGTKTYKVVESRAEIAQPSQRKDVSSEISTDNSRDANMPSDLIAGAATIIPPPSYSSLGIVPDLSSSPHLQGPCNHDQSASDSAGNSTTARVYDTQETPGKVSDVEPRGGVPGVSTETEQVPDSPLPTAVIGSIDDFLNDQRKRIEAAATTASGGGTGRMTSAQRTGASSATDAAAIHRVKLGGKLKRGGGVSGGAVGRTRPGKQVNSNRSADPSLEVHFSTDSEGDKDAEDDAGSGGESSRVHTPASTSESSTLVALPAQPSAKVGTSQRRANLSVTVSVPGSNGVPLTPGRAASALEKHIALLKKKIQQKTSSSVPSKATAKAAVTSEQPASRPQLPAIEPTAVAHRPESALHVQPAAAVSASTQPPLGTQNSPGSKTREDGRPPAAVGELRSQSPNPEMEGAMRPPPLLELRRRSPAGESAQHESPALVPEAESASRANHVDPQQGMKSGVDGVFAGKLQLGGRSRSPAAEAADLRRRSPGISMPSSTARPDTSSGLSSRPESRQGSTAPAAAGGRGPDRPVNRPETVQVNRSAPEDRGQMPVKGGTGSGGPSVSVSEDGSAASEVIMVAGATRVGSAIGPTADNACGAMEIDSAQEIAGHGTSLDMAALEVALSGSALSAESLQRAREVAERRLRGVRRLMEENLREDLELQMQIQHLEYSIAEQQQLVMAAQDLLNQELIRLAEGDD